MPSFAVVAATSWGVTLAALLARNGHEVLLVARDAREARAVNRARGLGRLPGLVLPNSVTAGVAADLPADCAGLVLAAPAQATRATLATLPIDRPPSVLSAAKGLETRTSLRMSEVIAERWPAARIAALSGPNLSREIIRGAPAAAVIASADASSAELWQRALSGGAFRAYTSDDVVGVELAGALKNVVAIAAGVATGLSFGANTVAAIMTRGLAEMTRLGMALGANPMTFQGLAGVGDLSATCFSPLSRNRRLGEYLARGLSPDAALARVGEVAEGAATAPVATALAARFAVEMPIAHHVAATLSGAETVPQAMAALLDRPFTSESGAALR